MRTEPSLVAKLQTEMRIQEAFYVRSCKEGEGRDADFHRGVIDGLLIAAQHVGVKLIQTVNP